MSQTIDTIIDKKAYEQVKQLRDDVVDLQMNVLKLIETGQAGFKLNYKDIKLPSDVNNFYEERNKYLQKQSELIGKIETAEKKYTSQKKSYLKTLEWEEKAERKLQLAKDRVKESESELGKEIQRTRDQANANNRVNRQTATLYGRVSLKLKETANEYYELALKKQLTGKASEEEIRRMTVLESRMDKYGDALMTVEKRSGNYHRQVGNYKKGFDGLAMSMAQITREGPAFAYSMQTGFLAISNNLPILFDEIGKVKAANKALAEEGKATKSVLSQVGAAILSWQTAMSFGITLLTIYGEDIIDWATSMGKATDVNRDFNRALAETRSSMQLEIVKLNALIDIAGDETVEREKRNDAVKLLQKEYPEYLKNLTTENSKSNEIADSINRITTALENKAKIQAAEQLITKEAQKLFEDQVKIEEEFATRLEKARQTEEKGINPNNYYDQQLPKQEANLVETLTRQKKAALLESEEDYKAYVKNLNNILRNVPNLFDAMGGEDGSGGSKKPNAKDYSAEDFYNLQKSRLERAIEVNKAITENEKEELSKRLEANNTVYENQQKLAILERDWAIANAKDRNNKILEAKEEFTANSEDLIKEYSETEKKILETNFKYQLDQFKKVQQANELALQHEINAVTSAMIAKGATREQIDSEIERIRKESLRRQLSAQIDQAEKELLVVAQTEEEKAEVYRKIAELREELNNVNLPGKTGKEGGLFSEEEIEQLRTVQDLLGGISDLFAAFSARRIEQIQAEMDANNEMYNSIINNEESTAQQKEEARKEQKEKEDELRKKLAKEKEKQARIDKAAAVAEIAINTAVAISKTLAQGGVIFGIPLVPIIAALGALQIATVLAQPIPQFKEGHLSGTYEGWAMINDFPSHNYREVLEQPDGSLYSPEERNQKVYMKRGAKVHKNFDAFLDNKGYKDVMDATIMASLMNHNLMATEEEINKEFNRALLSTIDNGIKKGFDGVKSVEGSRPSSSDFNYQEFINAVKKEMYFNL
ncbi:hypothetical protein MKO06_02695 [Gramella sp. GC03-9]|uniref:Uncharacterized protein n=1 Tax=Christiangramia oceanisediminis TaxID=2920386 RepID=A0A9X2I3Q8_9FLAO|nr:hypothetical protein [Gramella oceanisediminis]MCP9198797.1 hypothetical protein [Gramella oceanisediminis]